MALSDKQQADMGKSIVFGTQSINKPTPLIFKHIFRAIAFLSGVWAILPQDLTNISDHLYADINKWIIVGNTVILFAIKFFSWDYKQD